MGVGRWMGLALSAAALLAGSAVAQASAEDGPPGFTTQPAEEEWSWFADSSRRRSVLDRLKHVPLTEGGRWRLSMGGEIRPQYERYDDEEWGGEPRDRDGWLLQRYMLHADVRGPRLRVFAQLKSNLSHGRAGGPRPPDEDRLDLNQLFVEMGIGAIGDGGRAPVSARLGRQELQFGSGRLVAVREGPNTRLPWDGARATVRGRGWRVDGWAARPVETDPGVFDDSWVDDDAFWGVYATRPAPGLRGAGLDLFYLGYRRGFARYDAGEGRETRHGFGARLWRREGPWDYDLEAAWQAGAFDGGRIRAYFAAWGVGRTWDVPWRPRMGLAGGVASGDGGREDGVLETFDPPAPRGTYFGQATPLGPGNVMGFAPQLSVEPGGGLSATAEVYFFWRQSTRDGLYGIPGNLVRSTGESRARHVATQPQVEVQWQADRHLRFTLNYAYASAGCFLRETGAGRDIRYVSGWMTFRF